MSEDHNIFGDFPVLETERLLMRPLREGDGAGILMIYGDDEVALHTPYLTLQSEADAVALVEYFNELYDETIGLHWGITLKDEGDDVAGVIALDPWDQQNYRVVLGYALGRPYWSRGIMTEAVEEIQRFAFEVMGVNRLESRSTLGNSGALRLMQKTDFVEEGILREAAYWREEFCDLRVFSKLKRDWFDIPEEEEMLYG